MQLGALGEDLPKVVYRLIDPAQYREHKVLVVGGGDSALEAAISISEEPGTSVTISYRGEAFSRAKEKTKSDAIFAVAGRIGYGGDEIREAIEEARAGESVKLLGYVPDADVAPLYSGAWGLLFATLYEGFGIPVRQRGF